MAGLINSSLIRTCALGVSLIGAYHHGVLIGLVHSGIDTVADDLNISDIASHGPGGAVALGVVGENGFRFEFKLLHVTGCRSASIAHGGDTVTKGSEERPGRCPSEKTIGAADG